MKLGNMLVMGLATLAMTPSSWALVGGPWDHLIKGVYSRKNSDGLYQASVTMKDGSGFVMFVSNTDRSTLGDPVTTTTTGSVTSTTNNSANFSFNQSQQTLASRSNTVIFYKGSAYYGSVYGTVNAQSKSVIGGGGAQSSILDSVQTAAQSAAVAASAIVNVRGFSETMNIDFSGRIVKDVPEIRFEAKGEAIFFSRPNLKITQIPYQLPPGLTSITSGGTGQTTIQLPAPIYQIEAVTTGGLIKPDSTVKVVLRGGRVSLRTTFATTTTTGTTTNNNSRTGN